MKKGWEIKNMGDICSISTGKSNTEDAVENGRFAFFDRSKIVKRSSKYLFDCDAIIIAGEGQTFLPKYYSGKFDLHQRAYAIFNFNERVSIHYVYKYLIHFHKYFEAVAVGATAKSLRLRHFQDLPIPVPPLPDQKRIVAVLDESFAALTKAKENAEKNLVYARELFKSALQEMVSKPKKNWQKRKLEELFNIKHGFAFKSKYFSRSGKYILLTPGHFYEEGGYRDRGEKTKYYVGDIPDGFIAKKGDIMIAMTEQAPGLLGSPIIVPEANKYLHNQRLGLIKYKQENILDTNYLAYLFNTKKIRSQIHQSASGVKVRHTSPTKVLEINVFIPKLEEQQTIVKKLDALSSETKKLEAIYQQKLSALEELKKSLLQKAFNGEL